MIYYSPDSTFRFNDVQNFIHLTFMVALPFAFQTCISQVHFTVGLFKNSLSYLINLQVNLHNAW